MLFPFTTKKLSSITQRGFTIIELMVTITIVVLVTGVIMVQYSSFNNGTLLINQAYAIALDIREAQARAVSVRGNDADFHGVYGVYFNEGDKTEYILFQDNISPLVGGHGRYDVGEEIGKPVPIDPRFEIEDICVLRTNLNCTPSDLSIIFKRPDFDASFYAPSLPNITSAEVHIKPISGDALIVKKIVIDQSGQISVK